MVDRNYRDFVFDVNFVIKIALSSTSKKNAHRSLDEIEHTIRAWLPRHLLENHFSSRVLEFSNSEAVEGEKDKLLSTPLADLSLSSRTTKLLRGEGVTMLGDILQFRYYELLRIPGLGRKSVVEIKDKISAIGVDVSWPLGDPW